MGPVKQGRVLGIECQIQAKKYQNQNVYKVVYPKTVLSY